MLNPSNRSTTGVVLSHRGPFECPAEGLAFAGWYEAEDILVETSWPELSSLGFHRCQPAVRARRAAGWTLRRLAGRNRLLPPDRMYRPRRRAIDHVFFMAHNLWDLALLERLRVLRGQAVTVSVWLPELWPTIFEDPRLKLEAFSLVDHFFVGLDDVVPSVQALAPQAEVHVLPVATDVVRFMPHDLDADRPIDVLGIGRRDVVQHDRLIDWAHKANRLYLYDTLEPTAVSWPEHRAALAGLYRQSHISICNYAKHDLPQVTGGLRVIPMRLFEGLAAGTVLVGMPPDEARQRNVLGQIVVEPVVDSTGQLSPWFDTSVRDPRIRAMRSRNVALACRAHDWGHRWQTVFQTLDLPIPEGLEARLESLRRRADAGPLPTIPTTASGPGAA
jgi:hypothetical protein